MVACANVASMLLARGAARQGEISIRVALGAGHGRIIRQLLTESMLLALLGGIVGTIVAYWSMGALKGLFPSTVPRVAGIQVDGWVLFFAFIMVMVSGVIFGLAPALFSVRSDIVSALKGSGGSRSGGRRRNRLLSALVIAQLAVALMLVNGTVLLFVSYLNVARVPQGFDTREVLTANIQLTGERYTEIEGRMAFWDELIARLENAPGVERAAVTTKLPTAGGTNFNILVEGEIHDPAERRPLVENSYITPGYFEAMGVRLLQGRGLRTEELAAALTDRTQGNIVVNQAFVERYWPDQEPIGQRVRENSSDPSWTATVVGVVENVRQWGVTYPTLPEIYYPLTASTRDYCFLVLRAERDPAAMAPLVRSSVAEFDPLQPVTGFQTMATIVRNRMLGRRLYTVLIGLFTLIAVTLAIAGTYGVMSFHVTQRTREIGIRVAMGASRSQVLWHFIRRGLKLTLVGAGLGIMLAFWGAFILGSMIFGVSAPQLLYLLVAALLLGIVILVATAVPSLRGTRIDPVQALRAE
jgi:predicted permease